MLLWLTVALLCPALMLSFSPFSIAMTTGWALAGKELPVAAKRKHCTQFFGYLHTHTWFQLWATLKEQFTQKIESFGLICGLSGSLKKKKKIQFLSSTHSLTQQKSAVGWQSHLYFELKNLSNWINESVNWTIQLPILEWIDQSDSLTNYSVWFVNYINWFIETDPLRRMIYSLIQFLSSLTYRRKVVL